MRRLALFALLLTTLAPLAPAQQVGVDFPIAATRLGPAPLTRNNVQVAANRDQYLVVWEDRRTGATQPRVWATRITRTGGVVDETGFPLDPGGATVLHSVATDGLDFLIATTHNGFLRLVRVLRDGTIQVVPFLGVDVRGGELVWLGDSYALISLEPPDEPGQPRRARVTILDSDGRLLVRTRDLIASSLGLSEIQAARRGPDVLLAWADFADFQVHTRLVSAQQLSNGDVEPLPATPLGPEDDMPSKVAVAAGGDAYFVAYVLNGNYRGRILDLTGTPIGPDFFIGLGSDPPEIDVTWDGTAFIVAYAENGAEPGAVRLARYNESGTRTHLSSDFTVFSADFALASLDGEVLLAWESSRINVEEIHAGLIEPLPQFETTDGTLVSRSQPSRDEAAAVWIGDRYVVTWLEHVGSGSNVVVGRLSANGTPLDGAGVVLDDAHPQSSPAIATDGSNAVIAWSSRDNSWHMAFVTATSITVRELFDARGQRGIAPSVVWNGEEYAIAAGPRIVRVNRDGTIRDTSPAVFEPSRNVVREQLVWTGNQYLLFWSESGAGCPVAPCPDPLWMVSVSRDGFAVGAPLLLANTTDWAAAASSTGEALVAWTTLVNELRFARFSRFGAPLDPLAGVRMGEAGHASGVTPLADGWQVTSGPFVWFVARNGGFTPRELRYEYVSPAADADVIVGGAFPLVLFERTNNGTTELFGRFEFVRARAVRKR